MRIVVFDGFYVGFYVGEVLSKSLPVPDAFSDYSSALSVRLFV